MANMLLGSLKTMVKGLRRMVGGAGGMAPFGRPSLWWNRQHNEDVDMLGRAWPFTLEEYCEG